MARKPRPSSITAAASRVIDFESPRARSLATDAESLYGLYDRLGPIHAAMQSKFLAASKITYFPARKVDPNSDPEPVEDGPAREAFDRLHGPQGEFGDFVAEMGMHWEIAGEGYLVGLGEGVDESWDVWSPVEYEQGRKGLFQSQSDDGAGTLLPGAYVLRSWRSHPMRRELPDAPLRSVVDQCDQLILFQDMLTAIGRSRLSAGLLVMADEFELPDTGDDGKKKDIFDTIYEGISAAVQDTKSASRLVPTLLTAPGDRVSQINLIDFTRDLPEWVPDTIEKVTRQIAIGLDLPADILTGMADVNHWSAWLIDDSLRLNYVDPLILAVLDSFTRGYLVPALQEEGVADAEDYLFWRDYSDLSSRAVSSTDAISLYDRGIISEDATRRVVGFNQTDMPAADAPSDLPPDFTQKIEALGALIRAGFDPSESTAALGLPPIKHTGLLPVTVQRSEDVPSVVDQPDPAPEDVSRGTPDTMPGMVAAAARPSLAQIDHRVYTQISEAAQAALDRALERAGAKIRSSVRASARDHRPAANRTFASAIEDVDNFNVAMTLGRGNVATLQLSDTDLIPEDTFTRLGQRVEIILAQAVEDTYQAVTEITQAEPARDLDVEKGFIANAVEVFLGAMSLFAISRLFTPTLTPDPAETGEVPSTEIPPDVVFGAMSMASGGTTGAEATRGLANGQLTQDWVISVGYSIRERMWSVGSPAKPFDPHRALSGSRFEHWTDDKLRTPLTASWLGYDHMFPGDHKGCQCVAELVISEGETLIPVAA